MLLDESIKAGTLIMLVEKDIDSFKNQIDGKRLRGHKDSTVHAANIINVSLLIKNSI